MPTQKPRLNITLDPVVRASLADLSDALDIPASTFVSSLLLDSVEIIQELARIGHAAKAGRSGSIDELRNLLVGRIEIAQSAVQACGSYDAR
jgi:hypothetical protein